MVLSKFYEVGFDSQNGLPNYYSITPEGGGNGVDIVDRIKFNAFLRNISYNSPIGNLNPDDQFINENIVKKQSVLNNASLDDSFVRIIRNLRAKIEIEIVYRVLLLKNDLTGIHFP